MFKRAKISDVWNHFTVDSEQNKTAKCNICHLKLSFKGTVSNLNNHLKNKHLTLQPTQSRQVSQNMPLSVTLSASEASSSRSEEKHDDGNVSSSPAPIEQPSTSSSKIIFQPSIAGYATTKKKYGSTTKRNR
jgi:uncharacterized protein YegL